MNKSIFPNRRFKNSLAFLLTPLVILAGCEGSFWSARAPKDQEELAKKFAPEPAAALIYVYRRDAVELPSALFLYVDGEFVASPKVGSFIRLVVTPGTHVLATKSPSARSLSDRLTIVSEAEKLYYATVNYQARGVTGDSPKLSQVDEGPAQKEIRKYQLSITGPLNHAR